SSSTSDSNALQSSFSKPDKRVKIVSTMPPSQKVPSLFAFQLILPPAEHSPLVVFHTGPLCHVPKPSSSMENDDYAEWQYKPHLYQDLPTIPHSFHRLFLQKSPIDTAVLFRCSGCPQHTAAKTVKTEYHEQSCAQFFLIQEFPI